MIAQKDVILAEESELRHPLILFSYHYHVVASIVGRFPSVSDCQYIQLWKICPRLDSAASRLPRPQRQEFPTQLNIPRICMRANLSFHNSSRSISRSHLGPYFSTRKITITNRTQSCLTCAARAEDPLVPGWSSEQLLLLELRTPTHQSSGSSSINSCAAASRALSSFDIPSVFIRSN